MIRSRVMKPLARHMEETGTTIERLVEASGLEAKLVRAIASGNYTPSPSERQRLAAALGVSVEDVAWGHAVPVDHLWGHGPQFGRTP
jgi:transcriptional regulator with XRE-family HTH domain